MKFFNWMQNKLNGKSGSQQKPITVPLHKREEFSDWPHSLLTIGTFGNKALNSEIQTDIISIDEQEQEAQEQNPTPALSPDLSEFTPHEVDQLQKELTKLLKRKPAKQEELNPAAAADLPLDRFLNCPSSLEISRRISNAVVGVDPDVYINKEDHIERTISVIIGKCKEVRAEKGKNPMGKKSVSFLLKKMFVCSQGFSPAPTLRDTLQESRMEKLLRTILRKKIYPQSSSRTSLVKRYIEDKEEKSSAKWDKTDSEYIVLEI